MTTDTTLTIQDAKNAVLRVAFACEDGRVVVHSYRGPFGADWDLQKVLDLIDLAPRLRRVEHLLDHNLEVMEADGRCVYFAARFTEPTRHVKDGW